MTKFILLTNLAILLLFASINGQQIPSAQPLRIGFINKTSFADEKTGVEKYVAALKNAENPGLIPEPDEAKRRAALQKRRKMLVEPVENDIAAFLKEIETANNLVFFDARELDRKGQIVLLSGKLDITGRIVPLINEYFRTGAKPAAPISVPEARLAKINTRLFMDEKLGINSLTARVQEIKNRIRLETGNEPTIDDVKAWMAKAPNQANAVNNIVSAMQAYCESRGFEVVFDPSYRLPPVLMNFQIQDVTKEFISYYNQLNP